MLVLRGRTLEADLDRLGLLDVYGEAAAGLKMFRFSDTVDGYFGMKGGQLGSGAVTVSMGECSNVSLHLPAEDTIRYERVGLGSASYVSSSIDVELNGASAVIVGPRPVQMSVKPSSFHTGCMAATLNMRELDSYLESAQDFRVGALQDVIVSQVTETNADAELRSLVAHVISNFDYYGSGTASRVGRLMEALLVDTFVALLKSTGALLVAAGVGDMELDALRRAQEFMRTRYAEPLRMSDVAAAAQVGLRQLELSFRRHTDQTPRQFLSRLRLDRARRLLIGTPQISIGAVAQACGIAHQGRFAGEYRKRFGESPVQTRRRFQGA